MKGKINKGRLLVKLQEINEDTKNGIIIPSVVTKQKTAEVVIGGEEVKAGDTIYYVADGVKVVIDEVDYTLIGEKDVLYVL